MVDKPTNKPPNPPGEAPKKKVRHARAGNGIGQGTGWGGPAKGAGDPAIAALPIAPAFKPGQSGNPGAVTRNIARAQKAQALKDMLYDLANGDEPGVVRVRAAEAWLNREEGMPVSRNFNYNVGDVADLDDAALAARQEALARELREGAGGATPSPDPAQSSGVVH